MPKRQSAAKKRKKIMEAKIAEMKHKAFIKHIQQTVPELVKEHLK